MASHFRLGSKEIMVSQAVTGTTTYTSTPVLHILNLDNLFCQINATRASATLTGTVSYQVSSDYSQDQQGNVTHVGNWVTLTTTAISVASGTTAYGIDINQLGAPWFRIQYTNATGTGTISMYASGKGLQ